MKLIERNQSPKNGVLIHLHKLQATSSVMLKIMIFIFLLSTNEKLMNEKEHER